MRYLFLLLFVAAAFTYCTTMEPRREAETSDSDSVPSWFNNSVTSQSDSTFFYGFSLAAASDSTEAVKLSTESALRNLKFEIDRFAEEIREKTQETTGSSRYLSGQFIHNLRNSVESADLSSVSFTHEHQTNTDGVHHHFTRAELPADDVKGLLSRLINDSDYLEVLQTSPGE